MCAHGLLFIKTSLVKQYSYQNDFSGVFDALHQSFLVYFCRQYKLVYAQNIPHTDVGIAWILFTNSETVKSYFLILVKGVWSVIYGDLKTLDSSI